MKVRENPLRTIGLSPAIIDLGLTKDELYEHCKKVAQVLFARLHPDVHDGSSTPAVLQVSDALNLLKDRKVFEQAMTELMIEYRKQKKEADSTVSLRMRCLYLEKENRRLKKRLNVERRVYTF